jgi:hypothetical protein
MAEFSLIDGASGATGGGATAHDMVRLAILK